MSTLSPAQVLDAWKNLALATFQRQLDEEGLVVVENQRKSMLSKKQLAESTKNWKKLDNIEQIAEFKTLLKSYQQEIDANTKRCKTAEGYFLNMYKVMNR
jgi:homeobox protein cut-like